MQAVYAYLCNLEKCDDCSFPDCSYTTDKQHQHISKSPTEMRLIGVTNGVEYYMEYVIKENKDD